MFKKTLIILIGVWLISGTVFIIGITQCSRTVDNAGGLKAVLERTWLGPKQ